MTPEEFLQQKEEELRKSVEREDAEHEASKAALEKRRQERANQVYYGTLAREWLTKKGINNPTSEQLNDAIAEFVKVGGEAPFIELVNAGDHPQNAIIQKQLEARLTEQYRLTSIANSLRPGANRTMILIDLAIHCSRTWVAWWQWIEKEAEGYRKLGLNELFQSMKTVALNETWWNDYEVLLSTLAEECASRGIETLAFTTALQGAEDVNSGILQLPDTQANGSMAERAAHARAMLSDGYMPHGVLPGTGMKDALKRLRQACETEIAKSPSENRDKGEKSMSRSSIHDDFKQLLEKLDLLIGPEPTIEPEGDNPAFAWNVDASKLSERCFKHLAPIRRILLKQGMHSDEWKQDLDAVPGALNDVIGALAPGWLGWPMAPRKDRDPERASLFDNARAILTRFQGRLEGLPSEWLIPDVLSEKSSAGTVGPVPGPLSSLGAASSIRIKAPFAQSNESPSAAESEPQRRKGRLPTAESEAKRSQMLATLRQHKSLKDDPAALAEMVDVSESTVRRWLEEEELKYRDSSAANPEGEDDP